MVERRREHEHRDRRLHCCWDHNNGGNDINNDLDLTGNDDIDFGTGFDDHRRRDHDDHGTAYVVVRRSDLDNLERAADADHLGDDYNHDLYRAARRLVDNAVDAAVDSAGDRMPRPADNPTGRLPTDNDFWPVYSRYIDAKRAYHDAEDALTAFYGA